MPGSYILYDDWVDYDNRKKRERKIETVFCCEEAWEVNYLVSKIRKHHLLPEAAIRDAISTCCLEMKVPRDRETFVHGVMRTLETMGKSGY